MTTPIDPVAALRAACAKWGTQAIWADSHGVERGHVNRVLNGHRPPGAKILAALGLERVVIVRKKEIHRCVT